MVRGKRLSTGSFSSVLVARYDVFSDQLGHLLVDVRADELERFGNRVLVPLLPWRSAPRPLPPALNPVLDVDGAFLVLMTQLIAAVPRKEFQYPVTNVAQYRDEIIRALDVLLTGF